MNYQIDDSSNTNLEMKFVKVIKWANIGIILLLVVLSAAYTIGNSTECTLDYGPFGRVSEGAVCGGAEEITFRVWIGMMIFASGLIYPMMFLLPFSIAAQVLARHRSRIQPFFMALKASLRRFNLIAGIIAIVFFLVWLGLPLVMTALWG